MMNQNTTTIRVVLPYHLRVLAHITGDAQVESARTPLTQRALLEALEARYPMLCGTIRDQATGQRRAFLRYHACQEDLSLDPPDKPLPEAVVNGQEPFLIIGAIAGG